ncbi:MAG: hypothetical protein GXO85_09880 [Chlorobi bacterium]|nr:hypothetical protein [Chlorobiota bacterium]
MSKPSDEESPAGLGGQVEQMVSPFALFAGPTYYLSPGWKDYRGRFESIEETEMAGKKIPKEYYSQYLCNVSNTLPNLPAVWFLLKYIATFRAFVASL